MPRDKKRQYVPTISDPDRAAHNAYVNEARNALEKGDIEGYHKAVEKGHAFDERKGRDDYKS